MKKATRSYNTSIKIGHVYQINSKSVSSSERIRYTCLVMFRRYFGRAPSEHWHKDGFMAQALDKRGNQITLYQVNQDPPAPIPREWALVRYQPAA